MPRLVISIFETFPTICWLVCFALLTQPGKASLSAEILEPPPLRVYFVGNSVTDTLKYGLFADLAKSQGRELVWGRHVIPGTPLFLPLKLAEEGKESGFVEEPFGDCKRALSNHTWDAICLQPFDRLLTNIDEKSGVDAEGDLATISRFIKLALPKSPDARFYLYARWPRITINGKDPGYDKDAYDKNIRGVSPVTSPANANPPLSSKGEGISGKFDDFGERWNRKYTGGWDGSNETRDYFETLTRKVREAHPELKDRILLIPVGHVMHELDQQMKAGNVPGHKGVIEDLYVDGIHLNNKGSFLVASTFYATIFGADPAKLPAKTYEVKDAEFVTALQPIIWKIVREHELSGVKPR
ncbi:MAG: hypothetical protein SFX18_09585 [Pirellulales bacterium]|nr:hypothetical protein [Pirellulales bacterium]